MARFSYKVRSQSSTTSKGVFKDAGRMQELRELQWGCASICPGFRHAKRQAVRVGLSEESFHGSSLVKQSSLDIASFKICERRFEEPAITTNIVSMGAKPFDEVASHDCVSPASRCVCALGPTKVPSAVDCHETRVVVRGRQPHCILLFVDK